MWDSDFRTTCPKCDSKEVIKPPEPHKDENGDKYEHECCKCRFQWQHGDDRWPDREELVDSSIRECIVDFGYDYRDELRLLALQKKIAEAEGQGVLPLEESK